MGFYQIRVQVSTICLNKKRSNTRIKVLKNNGNTVPRNVTVKSKRFSIEKETLCDGAVTDKAFFMQLTAESDDLLRVTIVPYAFFSE